MAKHKRNQNNENEQQNIVFDTKLDILKYSTEVQSWIKDKINSDFVLATLPENQKNGVIQMTGNAYYWKRLLKTASKEHKKRQATTPESQNKIHDEAQRIEEIGNEIFESLMINIAMTVIMHRNVTQNHLLKMLLSYPDEEKENQEETTNQDIKTKITKLLKKEETT